LLTVAEVAATRSKDPHLVDRVGKRAEAVAAVFASYKSVQPALETLKAKPDDPAANQIAGRYFALMRGNWKKVCPCWQKGPMKCLNPWPGGI